MPHSSPRRVTNPEAIEFWVDAGVPWTWGDAGVLDGAQWASAQSDVLPSAIWIPRWVWHAYTVYLPAAIRLEMTSSTDLYGDANIPAAINIARDPDLAGALVSIEALRASGELSKTAADEAIYDLVHPGARR